MFKSQGVSRNHMAQSIKKQIGTLAAIKPEGHFFQIRREMFRAHFVPRSNDATLEQRECAFNRAVSVGGYFLPPEDFSATGAKQPSPGA